VPGAHVGAVNATTSITAAGPHGATDVKGLVRRYRIEGVEAVPISSMNARGHVDARDNRFDLVCLLRHRYQGKCGNCWHMRGIYLTLY
jgi:hypothetical protein